ncbi:MAG: PD40 domain-containing protein [Candidatus Eremiobacteraeota bacterium]|nr:PD40 domain-containing protein [Candidatus Eremiobacteraeota bacterium]
MLRQIAIAVLFTSCALAQEKLVYLQEDQTGKNIAQLPGGVLTQGPAWHLYPDISSDGGTLCFVRGREQFQLVLRQQGRETTVELELPRLLHPRISGDGRKLAFSATHSGRAQIGVISLQDLPRPQVQWIERPGDAYFPDLSSDGSWLVFQENRPGAKVIVRYSLNDGKSEDLTSPEATSTCPSFSFDDRQVVYSSRVDGNWDIYQRDLTSSQVTRKTTHPAKDLAPTLRRSGELVFASDRSGEFAIYQGPDPDPTRLTLQPGSAYAPRISGPSNLSQGTLPALPGPPRSSFGVVSTAEGVYVCGGHMGHEHSYPPESFSSRFDFYAYATRSWQSLPPRPRAAHGFSLLEHEGKIYALGGFSYAAQLKPAWCSLAEIDCYDPQTGRWTCLGQLPRARSSYAAAELDGKFYLFGGWDSTPRSAGDKGGRFHREVDVYDPVSQKCATLAAQLPDPLRRAFTAVVHGREILLIGGLGQGASHFELLDQVTAFQPDHQKWREYPPLPFATFAPAAGILDNHLWVFGGMFKLGSNGYEYVNHIFELPLAERLAWLHSGRYLRESKGFAQVVPLVGKKLGILGGHHYLPTGQDTPVDTFETFEYR